MTTVDIDSLLAQDEVRVLLDTSEHAGTIRIQDLADLVETHELAPLEHDALLRELDKRGIEIIDPPAVPEPPPLAVGPPETTTDALQLFLREEIVAADVFEVETYEILVVTVLTTGLDVLSGHVVPSGLAVGRGLVGKQSGGVLLGKYVVMVLSAGPPHRSSIGRNVRLGAGVPRV